MYRSALVPAGRARKPAFGTVDINWAHPFARSLVSLLLLNEGAGAPIDLARPAKTTLTTVSPVWTASAQGLGLFYAGTVDKVVTSPYRTALNCTAGLTLVSRFRTGSLSGASTIIGKPFDVTHSAPYFDYLHYMNPGGTLTFRVGATSVNANFAFQTNTDYFVVTTVDGTRLRIFVNGAVDTDSADATLPTNTNSQPIRLGTNAVGTETMQGTIYSTMVYARAFSIAETRSLYSAPHQMLRPRHFRPMLVAAPATPIPRTLMPPMRAA